MGILKTSVQRFDKVIYGVIIGLVLPVLGFLISYFVINKGGIVDFDRYLSMTLNSSYYQQEILIFCMLPNLFLFYLTNFRWNIYEFTKGLVAVTLILGLSLFFFTW